MQPQHRNFVVLVSFVLLCFSFSCCGRRNQRHSQDLEVNAWRRGMANMGGHMQPSTTQAVSEARRTVLMPYYIRQTGKEGEEEE
jgi:hypothetical protein